MQALSLTLRKRLSNSQPLFKISSNLVAYVSSSSTTTSSFSSSSSPPSPASDSSTSATLNLLSAPWSTIQSRGIKLSGSDLVRVGNIIENQARIYEVPPRIVAGYATVNSKEDDSYNERNMKEQNIGLRNASSKTKSGLLLKVTSAVPLLLIYPNAYSMLLANLFLFWHINEGIKEIIADYVHQEMTRNLVLISFRLFLIIAMKEVFLKLVFV